MFIDLTLALTRSVTAAQAQEVLIPDPGLNAAAREALDNPAGPLTEAELRSFTILGAPDRNTNHLAGLAAVRNAHTLLLFSHHLTTRNPRASLAGRGMLDLEFNALAELTSASGPTNLDQLRLSGNSLTTISVTADLTRVTQLCPGQKQRISLDLANDRYVAQAAAVN